MKLTAIKFHESSRPETRRLFENCKWFIDFSRLILFVINIFVTAIWKQHKIQHFLVPILIEKEITLKQFNKKVDKIPIAKQNVNRNASVLTKKFMRRKMK